MRDRRDAVLAVAAERRPQSRATRQAGGNAHRAAGIAAETAGREPRGDGSTGPARAAAGDPRAVVWIARPDRLRREERLVVARDAERQLVHVGLAENDRAGVEQSLHGRRVFLRDEVAQRGRARGVRQARHVHVVFDDQRHAVQHALRRAGGELGIRAPRRLQRGRAVEGDERVEVAVGLGAREIGLRQLDARDLLRADQRRRVGDAELGEIARPLRHAHASGEQDDQRRYGEGGTDEHRATS